LKFLLEVKKLAFFQGGCDKRSCQRSATASHSVAVDRTTNLLSWGRTLYQWGNRRPHIRIHLCRSL